MHVTLPNGLEIEATSRLDAQLTYQEIFDMKSYAKHGISIAEGDCVFDVGANIGLYTVSLAQLGLGLKIFSLEPLPDVFAVLKRNVQRCGVGATITLLNVGAGKTSDSVEFLFNPALTITTSMRQQDVNGAAVKNASLYDWLKAGICDLHRMAYLSERATTFIIGWLSIPILRVLMAGGIALYFLPLIIRGQHKVRCQVKPLSDILAEQDVQKVDLLKIDVEGSEVDVIEGIKDADWPKIKQLVIEVHDVAGRVQSLQTFLEQRGYRTIVDREDWELHKLLGIYTLYAIR